MKITKENIEAVLLDLSEGTLSADQVKELEVFVLLHPEYRDLFEMAAELPSVSNDTIVYEGKKDLRKYSFASTDEALIKELEGELTAAEQEELRDLLTHFPELQKDRERFAMTVLQKEHVIYPGKEKLKRRTGVLISLYPQALRIAAIFLLALITGGTLYTFLRDNTTGVEVVDITTPTDTVRTKRNSVKDEQVSNNVQLASAPEKITLKKKKRITKEHSTDRVEENITGSPQPLTPINATLAFSVPSQKLIRPEVSSPVQKSVQPAVAKAYEEEHFMDLYELTSKLVAKATKGKIDFFHKKTDEGSELAVNTGDFEFVRKRSK